MTTRSLTRNRLKTAVTLASLALLLLSWNFTGVAGAQQESPDQDRERLQDRAHQDNAEPIRDRDRDRDRDGDQDRDRLRQRLRDGIDEMSSLSGEDRRRMTENLDKCLQLKLKQDELTALFPGAGQSHLDGGTLLRLQERLIATAADDLPYEPMLAKIQEGQIKKVPAQTLEDVCNRMETHVRAAHRFMNQAVADGVTPESDPMRQRRMTREMAQQMWQGLNEESLEQLRERARVRARDGSCSLEDLSAAAETATQIQNQGTDPERATRLAGEALRQGYTAQQMRQLQFMVMAGHRHGQDIDDVVDDMEEWLHDGLQFREMAQHMIRAGWMGPGEANGPGGPNAPDHVGGGPGSGQHGQGGPGGDDDNGHGPGGDSGSGGPQGSGGQGSGSGSGNSGGSGR